MKAIKIILAIFCLSFFACSQGKDNKTETADLNYDQTMALIFPDSAGVNEWHGRPLGQEAKSDLALSNGPANGDCGNQVMLTNSSDKSVTATVSTFFPFTASPWEVSKDYVLQAGQSIHIGNSQVCHGGKNTKFDWKIQGAVFGD